MGKSVMNLSLFTLMYFLQYFLQFLIMFNNAYFFLKKTCFSVCKLLVAVGEKLW